MSSDIFEDISKKISKAAGDVGRKTNEVIERQRLRNQIVTMEREIGILCESMGKIIWERYEEEQVVEAELLVTCEAIAEKKDMIEKYKADLLSFSGTKACKTCGAVLDKDDAFCKKCGTRMKEDEGHEEEQ